MTTLRSRNSDSANSSGLPRLILGKQSLRLITSAALNILREANDPPTYFVQAGRPVRVRADEKGQPIVEELTEAMITGRLARVANFSRSVYGQNRSLAEPPHCIARDILALGNWPFPPLSGIVQLPILRPDGSIFVGPGYDPITSLFLMEDPGNIFPDIPSNPTPEQVGFALKQLTGIITDFPFDDSASLANFLGLLITPLVRPAIHGCVPLALINAPQQGTGKTVLCQVVAELATGYGPTLLQYSSDEEELRKKITSVLRSGAPVIVLDNVRAILKSDVLSSALTSTIWVDRLLGSNEILRLSQRATWIANGNNLQLGGDLARRCYRIDLNARLSQPWKRTGFRHPNLLEFVRKNRMVLIWSGFVLIRSWFAAGCPDFSGVHPGSFTAWANTVGGILEFAGVKDFLGNVDSVYQQTDLEASQWETFLLALWDTFQGSLFTTGQVCDIIPDRPDLADALPEDVGSPFRFDGSVDARFRQRLGVAFRRRVGTRFGADELFLESEKDRHLKIQQWRIARGNAGVRGASASGSGNSILQKNEARENPPAPPAVPAK